MSQRPCSSNADRTGRKASCQRAAHAPTGTALTASRASARPAAALLTISLRFWPFLCVCPVDHSFTKECKAAPNHDT
eukprot:3458165-Prymnesium_polylepis.1